MFILYIKDSYSLSYSLDDQENYFFTNLLLVLSCPALCLNIGDISRDSILHLQHPAIILK